MFFYMYLLSCLLWAIIADIISSKRGDFSKKFGALEPLERRALVFLINFIVCPICMIVAICKKNIKADP